MKKTKKTKNNYEFVIQRNLFREVFEKQFLLDNKELKQDNPLFKEKINRALVTTNPEAFFSEKIVNGFELETNIDKLLEEKYSTNYLIELILINKFDIKPNEEHKIYKAGNEIVLIYDTLDSLYIILDSLIQIIY